MIRLFKILLHVACEFSECSCLQYTEIHGKQTRYVLFTVDVHKKFVIGRRGGADSEATYNLCLVLKTMLQKS